MFLVSHYSEGGMVQRIFFLCPNPLLKIWFLNSVPLSDSMNRVHMCLGR